MNLNKPNQTLKPQKISNVRARLFSLKNLANKNQDSLIALQKSLQKHNTIDDPETTTQQFSKREQEDAVIQEKLWKYFKMKAQQHSNKIQKQKVNAWHKIIKQILTQAEKKIQTNQINSSQLQNIIKNKYKQIHQLYREIQNIKKDKISQKQEVKSRRKRSNLQTSRGERITVIQQNINEIKQEIDQRNAENQKIKIQIRKLRQERQHLLINILKNGYYLNDGVSFFIQKIVQIGYKVTVKDFPKFLDDRSKQYLLQQYKQIHDRHSQAQLQQTNRSKVVEKKRSQSNNQLGSLVRQQHFKDIYSGTKDYLLQLLLKQSWKKQEVKLPKINSKKQMNDNFKRRNAEKNRIKAAYSQQLKDLVKKIEFGVNLQTIF